MRRTLLTALLTLCTFGATHAQRVALKTNALYWGYATPNLGLELRLSRCFTLNLEAGVNLFDFHTAALHSAYVNPEVRYYFSARPQAGHFVGAIAAIEGRDDFRLRNNIYTGMTYGAGLSYGYALVLGKRWSLEGSVAAGMRHHHEKKYNILSLAPEAPNHTANKLGLLKAALSVTYILK